MHANVIRLERRKATGYPLEFHEFETALDAVKIMTRELQGRNDYLLAHQTGLCASTIRAYRLGWRSSPALETAIRIFRAVGFKVTVTR
jgi:hypothetical protein